LAEQKKPAAEAQPPRKKTAAEEFLDCFEALAALIRTRAIGYAQNEGKLAREFLARADDMIVRARGDMKKEHGDDA
jgi:hypothetical protein